MVTETKQQMVKPGYRQTEVEVIPEDWNLVKLNDISSIIGDGIHTTPEYVDSSDMFFINGNNLINSSIQITENTKCVDESELKKYKKDLNENTILMSINGTIGNLAVYKNEKVVLGKSAAYINLKRNVEIKFVFYLLQTPSVKHFYEDELTGTTIRNLSLKSIRNTPIPLPKDQKEQSAIAEALSNTDGLIEQLDKLITKKRNIKQGAMEELLTGRRRLLGFEGEWKVKKLWEIAEMSSGGTPVTSNNSYYGGKIPWVVIADMTSTGKYVYQTEKTITEEGLKNSSAKLFKKGTLLFAMYASIGKCSIAKIDLTCNQAILGIVTESIDTEFLYYYLAFNEKKFSQIGQTGTQNNLNKEIVQNLEIPYPSSKEQIAIAHVLSDMDAEIGELEKRRDKYLMIKKGMIQQLLTGSIRLR
jgi:type I restriction enzyme S subunit